MSIGSLFAQTSKYIWRKNMDLVWKDFKGIPNYKSGYGAVTAYGITFSKNFVEDSLEIKIQTYFIENKSWVNKSMATDDLLTHEKGHFNLAELYARKLRKELLSQKLSISNCDKITNEIYKNYFKLLDAEQDNYDRETNHSKEEEKQKDWNAKIEKGLEDLEPYSRITIRLPLAK